MEAQDSPLHNLTQFPLLRLRVTWVMEEPVELRGYTGNTLRGLTGTALRMAVCDDQQRKCSDCSTWRRCPWLHLFRTSQMHDLLSGDGHATPPPPLVLEPASTGSSFYPGDTFRMEAVLIGDGIDHQTALLKAFEHAGEAGLGGRRARMRLRHVDFMRNGCPIPALRPGESPRRPPLNPTLSAVSPPLDPARTEMVSENLP